MFSDPQKNIEQFSLQLGDVVADLGSGSGHYALAAMRAVGEKGRVYAVDIQKDMLVRLKNEAKRQGFDNVEIVWGDVEAPGGSKLADGVADAVVITNLLFQLENKEGIAKEAHRIVKKGGRLLLIDWAESFGGIGPHADQVVHKEEAEKIFSQAGFEKVRDIQAGAHHYGMIFSITLLSNV